MKVLELYKAIAESFGYTVEDDKFFYHDGEQLQPTLYESGHVTRHLILPTYDRIREGFGDTYHPFHPLCESVIEGQSPTVKFLRLTLIRAIKQYGITLIDNFLQVACGKRKPRSVEFADMKARITEGLKDPKFDDTLIKSWNKIKATVLEDKKMVRLHLGANREVDGVKYSRVCTYTNIFNDEAEDKSQYFLDAKLMRKADKAILVRLAKEVFNMMPSQTGSSDPRPYFGSMMRAWREFVIGYNRITHSMQEVKKFDKLNAEWTDEIDDLEQFENKIQTLALNAGEGAKKREKVSTLASLAKTEPVKPTAASDLPTPEEPGKVSLAALANGAKSTSGTGLFAGREPVMSAAERRARTSAPQNNSMFGNQNNNFSTFNSSENAEPSLFNAPSFASDTGSMFNTNTGNNSSMFNNNNSKGSIFDAPQNNAPRSMFDTQGSGSMFN